MINKKFVSIVLALGLFMSIGCVLGQRSTVSADLSGQWDMVANTNYKFILDLQQSGNQITGTMTSNDDASLPVETISGTISGGTIQFTRKLAGQQTQVYTGSMSGSTITGSFNQNGQGQYPWSASKVTATVKAPKSKSNPSIYAVTTDSTVSADLSGQWDMVANTNYNFKLDLQQNGNQITGTMTSKDDASLPVETISGTISGETIQFTRKLAGQQTQVYTGSLSGSSITGTFNQNGQGQYPWSATKASETKQAETAQLSYPSDFSDLVTLEDLSGLNTRVTDKNYDTALAINDKILAISLDPGKIVLNPPDRLDYSQYTTMTETQDGWGGCGGRSLLHAINIIKEMEHPYTPDLSFWYVDARQSELIKSGIQDNPTKTLVHHNINFAT